jgi:hypothetical protein
VARIAGLGSLVTTFPTSLASVEAISATGRCPLTGAGITAANPRGNVWAEGEILLGGAGNDFLEGRGADDIIDGDRALQVRISVRAGVDPTTGAPTGGEIASTDLMEHSAITGSFGPGATLAMTLQQAVISGIVDPGQLLAVREIPPVTAATRNDIDTAVFSGPRANYTLTSNANGSLTVADNVGTDGTDTVWNIERLQFTDQTVAVRPTVTLSANSLTFPATGVGATSAAQTVVITNTGLLPLTLTGGVAGGLAVTGPFLITATTAPCANPIPTGGQCRVSVAFRPTANGPATGSLTITSNAVGSPHTVALSGTGAILPTAPPGTPTVTAAANRTFTVTWQAATTGGPFTRYDVQATITLLGAVIQVGQLHPTADGTTLSLTFRDALLLPGVSYRFRVRAVNAQGAGPFGTLSAAVASRP